MAQTTEELIEALEQNDRFSVVIAKTATRSATYSKKGKSGGTYAHPVLALAFAEYLNADLAVDVKTVYLRYRSGDITLADEVLAKAEAAREFEESRDISKQVRHKFESTLAIAGAKSGIGYITNAIYEVLLGGRRDNRRLGEHLAVPVISTACRTHDQKQADNTSDCNRRDGRHRKPPWKRHLAFAGGGKQDI